MAAPIAAIAEVFLTVDGTNRIKAVELLLVAAFLAVATVAIIVILPKAAPADGSGSTAEPEVLAQTASGPLTTADRDFLFKIRQAGLWEIPSGNMAQNKSNNQKVKDVGRILAADHAKLDEQVRALAGQLGVVLPSEPNENQKKWLAEEMAASPGEEFDKIFANRLRLAHGSVFAPSPKSAPARVMTRSGRSPRSATRTSSSTCACWRAPGWSTTASCPSRRHLPSDSEGQTSHG